MEKKQNVIPNNAIIPDGQTWKIPEGAFRKCGGPS